ncbi:MAG: ribonuclease H-like domain-containing protein [Candidatus Krumholzibacteria bacterium]|nr:ribonuclease H-like domain-containing protein [Candidatus Krumholzibacteria bacterium]MDH4338642.1 ribonuclease H-like domain-containing protein [Candidatus Krumholzibacteria bacterium]MDH5270658.1 ribonuclease H-like domain-containing protein [Candidatus Krumholzibacteria bacterium]
MTTLVLMAPVDNLLKKQLAQIKARALMLAGRASSDDGDSGASSASPPANEIIESVVRTGAVTRGRDFPRAAVTRTEERPRRFPWWFRRRQVREERHGFEGAFQRMLEQLSSGDPLGIEEAVPGLVTATDSAPFYLIRRHGPDLDPLAAEESARFGGFSAWPAGIVRTRVGSHAVDGIEIVKRNGVPDPRGVLFLDIETAGLSANTYAFLVGLMYWEDGRFVSDQVFARDYNEEEGMLRHVRATMERFDTVVTYNGASFDLPFLRQRMTVLRVPDIAPIESVDLLHAARRVYKPVLPNCRLVTVEKHLRGVERVDDIPSRFIPRAYHEFVHTRDARLMRNVVYHNRMDVFTMAVMLNRMGEIPLATQAAGDTIPPPNPPHVTF